MVNRDVGPHFVDLTSRLASAPGSAELLAQHEPLLLKRYPGLAAWPSDGQLALYMMAWAAGPGFHLAGFRSAACRLRPDFWFLGQSCELPHRGCPAIVALNTWNRQLFGNAAVVDSLGMAPDRVYFPADLIEMVGWR